MCVGVVEGTTVRVCRGMRLYLRFANRNTPPNVYCWLVCLPFAMLPLHVLEVSDSPSFGLCHAVGKTYFFREGRQLISEGGGVLRRNVGTEIMSNSLAPLPHGGMWVGAYMRLHIT